MPHTIDQFPRRKRGRPPKYDWESYFDGQIHVLYSGQDFDISPKSFRALVHRTARSREGGEWRAETQIDKTASSVAFRFYIEGENG
jgi:hypothetical protein